MALGKSLRTARINSVACPLPPLKVRILSDYMVNNEPILVVKGKETKQPLTKSDMNIKTQTKQYPLPTEVITRW
jgi:hypothetical protein